jgi:hypothetical protein
LAGVRLYWSDEEFLVRVLNTHLKKRMGDLRADAIPIAFL